MTSEYPVIPSIVHKSFRNFTDTSPETAAVKRLNPDWEFRYYNDADAERWIASYSEDAYRAWNLIDPAYAPARSDLFRYCLMQEYGGVWLDHKSFTTAPFKSMFSTTTDAALTFWHHQEAKTPWEGRLHTGYGEVCNWFLAFKPGHPFFESLIERVIWNIDNYAPDRSKVGKNAVIWLTGPGALTLEAQACGLLESPGTVVSTDQFSFTLRYSQPHYSSLRTPVVVGNNPPTPASEPVKARDGSSTYPTYVINLDRARERLRLITKRLDELGMTFTRWPAVDGSKLTDVDCNAFRRTHPNYIYARSTNDGIRGWTACVRSHRALAQHIYDTWTGPTLVLEDDCVLSDNWEERTTATLDALGDECELLLVGSSQRQGTGYAQARNPRLQHAYLIVTRQMALDLATAWLDESTESDEVWWKVMQRGTTYCLTPPAAHQGGGMSFITGRGGETLRRTPDGTPSLMSLVANHINGVGGEPVRPPAD